MKIKWLTIIFTIDRGHFANNWRWNCSIRTDEDLAVEDEYPKENAVFIPHSLYEKRGKDEDNLIRGEY